MRVMIQMRSSPRTRAAAHAGASMELTTALGPVLPGILLDHGFEAVAVPTPMSAQLGGNRFSLTEDVGFAHDAEQSTYIVRGTISDSATSDAVSAALANPEVVGIFSDPKIESVLTCGGSPPKGTDANVAKLVEVPKLKLGHMEGSGVYLAIVDTGINKAHLVAKGRTPNIDVAHSWTPAGVLTTPGLHPVNHGTMCAFDATIAAPKATLLDHAVLLSTTPGGTVMAGLLSDAVKAYSKLLALLLATPIAKRAMVVSNSWGMFSPAWDFPIGHPGNYSDNPAHPFNVIVRSLEHYGADIFFAAGNCGVECPDGRCAFGGARPICGANSHPSVYSIGGIDITKSRVGYSSQGPGRLSKMKPDVMSYTHFKGSGVYAADSGTSAACPVAAGVIAAVRSRYPVSKISPANLRNLVQKTALDLGGTGFDYNYGWGAIDTLKLLAALHSLLGFTPTVTLKPTRAVAASRDGSAPRSTRGTSTRRGTRRTAKNR